MQSVIASQRAFEKQTGIRPEERMEFEAFVLNEMCQFTGAFCNSLHCDEMGYLCRVPYWLGTVRDDDVIPEKMRDLQAQVWEREPDPSAYDDTDYLCGETGCGLCALYKMRQAGITHLKLVAVEIMWIIWKKISGIYEKRWTFWKLRKMRKDFSVR